MNATGPTIPNELIFRHFQPEDLPAFLAMVSDTGIKAYFEEFNQEEEFISYKFNGINEDVPYVQYWGIFLPDGMLAGFISLKKSGVIQRTLQQLSVPPETDNDHFEILSDNQIKQRKWRETIKAPYCADLAIHPDHRRKGIARTALTWLNDYAASVGQKEICLEVQEGNTASAQLIAGTAAELVIPAARHYGHDVYKFQVKVPVPDLATMLEDAKAAKGEDSTQVLNMLRYIVRAFPGLYAHRELLLELLWAIKNKGAGLEAKSGCIGCKHDVRAYVHWVVVCLGERPEPITLLWSLAHELGHLMQQDPTERELREFTIEKFRREEDAWKKAETWLNDKPLFLYQWESFFRFRHERLNSYTPSWA